MPHQTTKLPWSWFTLVVFLLLPLQHYYAHAALVHPHVVPLHDPRNDETASSAAVRRRTSSLLPLPFSNTTILATTPSFPIIEQDEFQHYLPPVCNSSSSNSPSESNAAGLCFTSTVNNSLTLANDFCIVCDLITPFHDTNGFADEIARQIVFISNHLPTNKSAIFVWIKKPPNATTDHQDAKTENISDVAVITLLSSPVVACVYLHDRSSSTLAVQCTAHGEHIADVWRSKLAAARAPSFTVDSVSSLPGGLVELLSSACTAAGGGALIQNVGDLCKVYMTSSSHEPAKDICIKCHEPSSKNSNGQTDLLIDDVVTAIDHVQLNHLAELSAGSAYIVLTNLTDTFVDPTSAVRLMRGGGAAFAKSLIQTILLYANETAAVIDYPYGLEAPQTIYYNNSNSLTNLSSENDDETTSDKIRSILPAVCANNTSTLISGESERNETDANYACQIHRGEENDYCVVCDGVQLFQRSENKSVDFDAEESVSAAFDAFLAKPLHTIIENAISFNSFQQNYSSLPDSSAKVNVVINPLPFLPHTPLVTSVVSKINDLLRNFATTIRDGQKLPLSLCTYYFFINASVDIYQEQVRYDLPGWPTTLNVTLMADAWEPTDELEFSIVDHIIETNSTECILKEDKMLQNEKTVIDEETVLVLHNDSLTT